jgi:hypothetical protein
MTDAAGYIFGPKFDALRNAIYHVSRRNYFDLLSRILNFLVVILGASVAGKAAHVVHVPETALEFGVLLVATAQLTFDFSYRARTHEILQKDYYNMLAEIELDPTPDQKRYDAKLYTIAADEPMPMRALDALAYNAALDATTSDPEIKRNNRLWIPKTHRLLRHILVFHAHEYILESQHVSLGAKIMIWLAGREKA